MALGASRSDVLQLVVGAFASFVVTRIITDTLFRVAPLDRSVFLIVTLVLMVVSMTAALVDALRAANVNPMRTLRSSSRCNQDRTYQECCVRRLWLKDTNSNTGKCQAAP